MKWLLTILYGLFTIWTGILRGIEAQAYKPNALWFCLTMGVLAIAAGFLYRAERRRAAAATALFVVLVVFGFYLHEFIQTPEENATVRVGLILVASLGQLVVVLLPRAPAPPAP